MDTPHVVLLGDSIFDKARYVPGGPTVIDQLRERLPLGWRATLVAHDGDVVADLARQIPLIPRDGTHLVVSVGGNDALMSQSAMTAPARSVIDALVHLAEVRRLFQLAYRTMLGELLQLRLKTAVCTIYDAVPGLRPELQTAHAIFNDTITREAAAAATPFIDLRQACVAPSDFSEISPIEPSVVGGWKIAQAIGCWLSLTETDKCHR
jgi:hypothetical protein